MQQSEQSWWWFTTYIPPSEETSCPFFRAWVPTFHLRRFDTFPCELKNHRIIFLPSQTRTSLISTLNHGLVDVLGLGRVFCCARTCLFHQPSNHLVYCLDEGLRLGSHSFIRPSNSFWLVIHPCTGVSCFKFPQGVVTTRYFSDSSSTFIWW